MRYWFDDKERVRALRAELESWRGTPFRHKCGVKGLGADCIHMVCHALINVGAVPAGIMRRVPDYPRDWHLHTRNTLLQDMIEKHLPVDRVPVAREDISALRDGDIVLYKFGRSNSHAAIICGGTIYQVIEGVGFAAASLSDRQWNHRIRRAYRLTGGAEG